MPNNRSYSTKNLKVLVGLSGGICALCKQSLFSINEYPQFIGQLAHIYGLNKDSRRFNEKIVENGTINSPENLIILCPTCHKRIDAPIDDIDNDKYSVKFLYDLKNNHEKFVLDNLSSEINKTKWGETKKFKNLNNLLGYLGFELKSLKKEDEEYIETIKKQILSLNNLNLQSRIIFYDILKAYSTDGASSSQLSFSYFEEAYSLETVKHIYTFFAEQNLIEEYEENAQYEGHILLEETWKYILNYLRDSKKISKLRELIIERNYSILE